MSNKDELIDLLVQLNEDRLAEFAEKGYDALRDIFSCLPERWGKSLPARLHEDNRPRMLELLRRSPALSSSAQELRLLWSEGGVGPGNLDDPSMLTDISGLLSLLLQEYSKAFPGQHRDPVEDTVRAALDAIAGDFVAACRSQIRALGRMVCAMLHERTVVAAAKRLLLVELPVGNSIPTQILCHFLEKHECPVAVVRASLSRNDKASLGVTREQLLADRLQGGLWKGDLVILVDEWMSGSNFRAISQRIARIVRAVPRASFLPVGMLTEASSAHERYRSHVEAHDGLLAEFGFGPGGESRFRVVFSPLKAIFPRPDRHYFFWSESDRLAGYRKFDPLGRCLATTDRVVEMLMRNPEALPKAIMRMAMHMAVAIRAASGGAGLTAGETKDNDLFLESMRSCCEDYRQVREEIRQIEHDSNLGRCDDPVQAIREVCQAVMKKLNGRPAVVCVGLGLTLAEDDFGTNPEERKILEEHAPLVVETDSSRRWFHDRLMEKIVEAIESWA